MTNNKQQIDYKYPVGDFLSGFSEDFHQGIVHL